MRIYLKTQRIIGCIIKISLLIIFVCLTSCSSDEDSSTPANYDGYSSLSIAYEELKIIGRPSSLIIEIYDEEDNQIYVNTWEYIEFIKIRNASEDRSVLIENIPSGPNYRLIVYGIDAYSNLVSVHSDEITFSLPVSATPKQVNVTAESFIPKLLSPEESSKITMETLTEFSWTPVLGAEKYQIQVLHRYGSEILIDQVVDDNYFLSAPLWEVTSFVPAEGNISENPTFFPDSGQNSFYSNDDIIGKIVDPAEEFFGQDASYVRNSKSYSSMDFINEEFLILQNTPLILQFKVTSIDQFGNKSPASDLRRFYVIPRMVLDNITGLTWEVKTKGDESIHEVDKLFTWQETNEFINSLNINRFGGYNDWRLPEIHELSSIINLSIDQKGRVKVDPNYFPNTASAMYRSATLLANYNTLFESSVSSWNLNFATGDVIEKNYSLDSLRVQAVRGSTVVSQLNTNNRFVPNESDETIMDVATGLIWAKHVEGPMTWAEALSYCKNISGSPSRWRLPNRNELHSIIDYTRIESSPHDIAAINPIFIKIGEENKQPLYYWSSSTAPDYPQNAITINFQNGTVTSNNKVFTENVMVRAVRDND